MNEDPLKTIIPALTTLQLIKYNKGWSTHISDQYVLISPMMQIAPSTENLYLAYMNSFIVKVPRED